MCLGNYEKAQQQFLRALKVYDGSVGPDHIGARAERANLALVYQHHGQYEQALSLLRAVLMAAEQSSGQATAEIAGLRMAIANVCADMGRPEQADEGIQQSLSLVEKSVGVESCLMVEALERYAGVLRDWHRETEARRVDRQPKAIRKRLAAEADRSPTVHWFELRRRPR